ncbi:unnamed protein product [Meloidogyne enterolobii]|uniref:Uncharacterized protein n=2 Tax=Meloidogyne enterolobii TaxID=390850 RepID=A0ACB0XSY9_MELEN|nr:unnamed protein product [Meloidogyne enterolobii]
MFKEKRSFYQAVQICRPFFVSLLSPLSHFSPSIPRLINSISGFVVVHPYFRSSPFARIIYYIFP